MEKYDSILYGNGLTLGVFNQISKLRDFPLIKYLDSTDFFLDLIEMDNHKKIKNDYFKCFDDVTPEVIEEHKRIFEIFIENEDDIRNLGFERWVSLKLFDSGFCLKRVKELICFIYNYWFSVVYREFLNDRRVKQYIAEVSGKILDLLKDDSKIYTTNFDTLLDEGLKVQHIHGKFENIISSFLDIILVLEDLNTENFEYKYLFGTNGYEKLNRIGLINKRVEYSSYNLDFFYDDSLSLGHLLIYGLAFGKAECISDEFIRKYPQHSNLFLTNSVDGHILTKLLMRYQNKQLHKVTIAWYSDEDKKNYKELFKNKDMEQLSSIIEYKHCSELFDLATS